MSAKCDSHVGLGVPGLGLVLSVTLSAASLAAADHAGDVLLTVDDGVLVTGSVLPDDGWEVPVVVFTGEFGDSGFPGFTANPGFDAEPGTFLPGTKIGFNILEPLKVWSGSGFEQTAGETMTISFLTLSAETGSGFVPGFELAVQANGGFHRHYSMFLNGPLGSSPAPGAYLLVRELYSTDSMVAPSAPFYFVMGHLVAESVVDEAADWLLSQLQGPTCAADLTGDGEVDGADLGVLLAAWDTAGSTADLDGNGTVDGADLGALLAAWGSCGG